MTRLQIKENLITPYNETIANLQRIEGAIAVLNQLEEETSEESSESNGEESDK